MKNSSRCFWGCDQGPVWKIVRGKDNDNPTDLSPYSNQEESDTVETMIELSEKEELRENENYEN